MVFDVLPELVVVVENFRLLTRIFSEEGGGCGGGDIAPSLPLSPSPDRSADGIFGRGQLGGGTTGGGTFRAAALFRREMLGIGE